MEDKTRRVLELFVEKADTLERRNFVRFFEENGLNYTFSVTIGQAITTSLPIPDEEALAALMVTFRMFIQDNDSISLRNIGKLISDSGLSDNWKAQIQEVRDMTNALLDRPPPIAVKFQGSTPTASEIMYTFIYGDIAHTSSEKRERLIEWQQNPILFQVFQHAFHNTVIEVYRAIEYISEMTKLELAGEDVPRTMTAEEREEQQKAFDEERRQSFSTKL